MGKKLITMARANFLGFRLSSYEVVYGQPIVEEQLTNAFLTHSDNTYQYMCVPNSFDDMAIKRINHKKIHNKMRSINIIDILSSKEKYRTDIFHSINSFKDMLFIRENVLNKFHLYPLRCTVPVNRLLFLTII